MLLQANTRSLPHIGDFDVEKIIVNAHPGNAPYHLMPSGINGDLGYIWSIGQKRSYIVTSGANKGGVENWSGSFDNEVYWYGINTPLENCVQGVIPDVRLGN